MSFEKIKLWFAGGEKDARDSSDHNAPRAAIGLPTAFEGDRQDDVDGTILGGVVWGVEEGSHGARAFVTSWCFIAYYDAKKREVHLLDNTGKQRHPGQIPKRVADGDITIYSGKKRSGIGYVTRTAAFGQDATNGIGENVFKHFDADLIAHHLHPDPPDNSSMVYDPDNEGRAAGLHWAVRVRAWVDKLCRGKTTTGDGEEIFALMLNYGTNGDGTPAFGLAHFNRGEATLSDEGGGPTACADDGNHIIARTRDGLGHQGANNIETLYGPIQTLYMPEEWVNAQHPKTSGGPFKITVEKRPDFTVKHKNYCGRDVDGKLRWHASTTHRVYEPPPSVPPPDTPPPTDDPPPTVPPIIPVPSYVPHEPRPTSATPNEHEAPSEYGHPIPRIPDGPTDWPEIGSSDKTPNYSFTHDDEWHNKLGFTEAEWNRVNLTTHDVALPEYLYDAPQVGPDRWPTKKDSHESLIIDDDGNVEREKTATGPGTKMLMPAWARAWHGLQKFKHLWKDGTHNISRIIMSGVNAAGAAVVGRFGMGMRDETDGIPRRGWDVTSDFSNDADNPTTVFTSRDEDGAQGTGDFDFVGGTLRSNGTAVGLGTGNVSETDENDTDNAAMRADGTSGRTIQKSDVIIEDVSGNDIDIHPTTGNTITLRGANNAGGNGTALNVQGGSSSGSSSEGADLNLAGGAASGTNSTGGDANMDGGNGSGSGATHGAVNIGTGTTSAVTVGKAGITTTVNGTLSLANALAITSGGTGGTTAAAARSNLSVEEFIAQATGGSTGINSTSVANLVSSTVTVADRDTFELHLTGAILNNSGAARTYTARVTIGATTFDLAFDGSIAASATDHSHIEIWAEVAIHSSSLIYCTIRVVRGTASALGTAANNVLAQDRRIVRTSTNNEIGASKAIAIGLISDNATATQTFYLTNGVIRR